MRVLPEKTLPEVDEVLMNMVALWVVEVLTEMISEEADGVPCQTFGREGLKRFRIR